MFLIYCARLDLRMITSISITYNDERKTVNKTIRKFNARLITKLLCISCIFLCLALTDIKFVLPPNVNRFRPMFELRFKKEGTWYSVNASESSVTASEVCCLCAS
jgi:hypothetical protein